MKNDTHPPNDLYQGETKRAVINDGDLEVVTDGQFIQLTRREEKQLRHFIFTRTEWEALKCFIQ